jgi:hypothetical protein
MPLEKKRVVFTTLELQSKPKERSCATMRVLETMCSSGPYVKFSFGGLPWLCRDRRLAWSSCFVAAYSHSISG